MNRLNAALYPALSALIHCETIEAERRPGEQCMKRW